ncbi:hypothetical protein T06_64 [Trichinella sp. T6]|nr:hypothetical protein T06_64 [Trichinella sp. T6]
MESEVDNCLGDFASSLNDLRSASAVDEEIRLNQRFKSSPRLNSSGQQYQLRYGTLLTRLLMQSPDAPANEYTAPLSSLTRSTLPTANRNTPHLSLYKRDYLMFMYY